MEGTIDATGWFEMCVEIEFEDGIFDGVLSLNAALPSGVVRDAAYGSELPKENHCLCCVDVEKTAQANGLTATEVGSMCYLFETNTEEAAS